MKNFIKINIKNYNGFEIVLDSDYNSNVVKMNYRRKSSKANKGMVEFLISDSLILNKVTKLKKVIYNYYCKNKIEGNKRECSVTCCEILYLIHQIKPKLPLESPFASVEFVFNLKFEEAIPLKMVEEKNILIRKSGCFKEEYFSTTTHSKMVCDEEARFCSVIQGKFIIK